MKYNNEEKRRLLQLSKTIPRVLEKNTNQYMYSKNIKSAKNSFKQDY
jgi:hypothetical protein